MGIRMGLHITMKMIMKPRTIECEQNEWKTKLENGGYQTLKLL